MKKPLQLSFAAVVSIGAMIQSGPAVAASPAIPFGQAPATTGGGLDSAVRHMQLVAVSLNGAGSAPVFGYFLPPPTGNTSTFLKLNSDGRTLTAEKISSEAASAARPAMDSERPLWNSQPAPKDLSFVPARLVVQGVPVYGYTIGMMPTMSFTYFIPQTVKPNVFISSLSPEEKATLTYQ